jgi:uncharacterized OsmC-like protein
MASATVATLRVESTAGPGGASRHNVRDLPPIAVDAGQGAPSPLELVLVALNGCTSILAAMVAREQGFSYTGIRFETEGEVDHRGMMGVPDVAPYFQVVRQTVRVATDEPEERIAALQAEVERRCPLATFIRGANVTLASRWLKEEG